MMTERAIRQLETDPPEHRNSLGYVISDRNVGQTQAQAMIVWGRNADGNRVSIIEATRGSSEHLKCECGADLVARKGEINAHHFAHASGADACKKAQVDALCHFSADALANDANLQLPTLLGRRSSAVINAARTQVFGNYTGVCVTWLKGTVHREMAVIFTVKRRQLLPSKDEAKAMGISAIAIDLAPHRNQADIQIVDAIRTKADRRWLYNKRLSDAENEQIRLQASEKELERHKPHPSYSVDLKKPGQPFLISDNEWKTLSPDELRRRIGIKGSNRSPMR